MAVSYVDLILQGVNACVQRSSLRPNINIFLFPVTRPTVKKSPDCKKFKNKKRNKIKTKFFFLLLLFFFFFNNNLTIKDVEITQNLFRSNTIGQLDPLRFSVFRLLRGPQRNPLILVLSLNPQARIKFVHKFFFPYLTTQFFQAMLQETRINFYLA